MGAINFVDFCCASAIQTSLMALGLSEVDVTAIILAVIGMVSGWATYWFDRKKHKTEVKNLEAQIEGLKADNDRKYLDLATEFATKFKELIVKPLESEVQKLRTEVNELRDAIREINKCPLCDDCPVLKRMQHKQESEHQGAIEN